MRLRFILSCILIIAGVAGGLFFFGPTFNMPVLSDVVGFKDEARLLRRLNIADGYRLSLFATSVGRARVIRQTRSGNFIVTAARDGRVLLVRGDHDGDGRSDGVEPLGEDLVS